MKLLTIGNQKTLKGEGAVSNAFFTWRFHAVCVNVCPMAELADACALA